jgi:hypothetical protein
MAAKKKSSGVPATEAKFPYTNKPASLRKMLKAIPSRPKPTKVNEGLLKSWEFRDTNDRSIIRVLKAVRLLNGSNEPTDVYTKFMDLVGGPPVLGAEIKKIYAPLFTASHTPFNESPEKLRNLFNIHSGSATLDLQIQTFKALCESASFDAAVPGSPPVSSPVPPGAPGIQPPQSNNALGPAININLHIHLPENKTRRDYEAIIEDIGRYIFGRNSGDRGD